MTLSKCFHCNGYYGPSYGQPVCSTCHMFLYPDDSALHSSSFHVHDLKVEDGDSGNEEPVNEEQREPSDCNVASDTPGLSEAAGGLSLTLEEGADSPAHPVEPQSSGLPHFTRSEQAKDGSNLGGSTISVSLSNDVRGPSDPSLPPPDRGVSPPLLRYDLPQDWEELPQGQEDLSPSSTPSENQVGGNIHSIPPEVLLVVFEYLDEVSLWSCGQVCRRWSQLVRNSWPLQWRVFLQRRWPLFSAIYTVTDWHKVFTSLIESAPCQLCLFRMPYNTVPADHEDSWRRKRLSNERRTLQSDPPEGIHAFPLDKLSLHWQATIRGPSGSPYQGGTFFLYIQIPNNYPLSPPLVQFTTRLFHPNVSRHGDIGIDSIQHNWSVAITISKVLVSIQSLFTDPYTKVCMEPRIGEMYEGNRVQFERIARAWTWCYAMHDAIEPGPAAGLKAYLHRITAVRGADEGEGEELMEQTLEEEEEEEEEEDKKLEEETKTEIT